MKRFLWLIILLFVLCTPVYAQTISTTTCPGAGCADIDVAGQGSIGIQITGTFVGTITFQSSIDRTTFTTLLLTPSGSTTAVGTTTAPGLWTAPIAGITTVRVVFTAYTSGSAVVRNRTTNQARSSGAGGGGGGGSGTVTSIATTSPITGGTITTTGTIACATCGVTGTGLQQFASTTSAQFAGVISNETGSGLVTFNDGATLNAPVITGGTTITGNVSVTGQYNAVPSNHGAAGAAETVDFNVSNTHTLTLDENLILTLSNPVDGGRYIIVFRQDGTGTNTVTFPSTVEWPDGDTPIVITPTADAVDVCTFLFVSAVTKYYGACSQNYVE